MTKINKCLCGGEAEVRYEHASDTPDMKVVYIQCTECKLRTEGSYIDESWTSQTKDEVTKDEIWEWNDHMESRKDPETPKNPSKYYLTPEEFFDGPGIIYAGGPFTGYYRKYHDPGIACDRAYRKNQDLWAFRISAVVIIVSLLYLWQYF